MIITAIISQPQTYSESTGQQWKAFSRPFLFDHRRGEATFWKPSDRKGALVRLDIELPESIRSLVMSAESVSGEYPRTAVATHNAKLSEIEVTA
jgi:hypothetical protein